MGGYQGGCESMCVVRGRQNGRRRARSGVGGWIGRGVVALASMSRSGGGHAYL